LARRSQHYRDPWWGGRGLGHDEHGPSDLFRDSSADGRKKKRKIESFKGGA